MIEERGRVVAVEPEAAWVQTVRSSSCSTCSARAGCGQGLMDRLGVSGRVGLVRAHCPTPVRQGDEVVIGIAEDALLRASLLVYLFPLISLLAGSLLAQLLFGLGEPFVIISGLVAFALAWAVVCRHGERLAGRRRSQPVVLRTLPADASATP